MVLCFAAMLRRPSGYETQGPDVVALDIDGVVFMR
jgi:hypothetical protein